MVTPPQGLSGTSSAPITLRALNDGAVLIDGEFVRIPVQFRNNSWWVLQGFNARSSSRQVAILGDGADSFTGPGSNNNVIRRCIFWDADIRLNVDVITHANANNNLWEDSAFFGTGRRVWSVYTGYGNICRRCWIRWEGNTTVANSGPKRGTDLGYGGVPNGNTILESTLVTWNAYSQPQSFQGTDAATNGTSDGSAFGTAYGNSSTDHYIFQKAGPIGTEANPGEAKAFKIYGSATYILTRDFFNSNASPGELWGQKYGTGQIIQDGLSVMPLDYPGGDGIAGANLGPNNNPNDGTNTNTAKRVTSIRQSADTFGASWSDANLSQGMTLGSVPNPWTTTGAGANLCFQYINGVKTTTPLWPWPMNQRIIDALNAAGSYRGPCNGCSGGMRSRAGTADVTADIQSLLGTIPAACRN